VVISMIIRCVADSGGQRVAPAYGLTSVFPAEFRLTRGREYEVYGFALFEWLESVRDHLSA
jgi:hypothetical protein